MTSTRTRLQRPGAAAANVEENRPGWRVGLRRWGPGLILVSPALALILVMMVYPVIQTVWYSFSKVQLPGLQPVWTGFANFAGVLNDPATGPLVRRTLIWIVATVVLRFILGFLAALVFNARVKGTIWLRVLVILPWTVPSVVAANLWRWILQADTGLLNQTLRAIGLEGLAANWLGQPGNALFSVILAYSWAGFPFIMLLILAGLQGIPDEYYEAAKVDGANWWRTFWHITVPSVRRVLAIALLLELVSAINGFDTIMVMTSGGPAKATEIWGIAIYQSGFVSFNFGRASAMSVLLFAAALVFFIVYGAANKGAKRRVKA
jgi:multiple sugar transport system permease protein